MANNGFASSVMVSNLLTMAICAQHDKRQKIGEPYTIPADDVLLLRAKLILEEAKETIAALGCRISAVYNPKTATTEFGVMSDPSKIPNLEGIIDGCCDVIYVADGTLVSCGVPDAPHLQEVCEANEDKFPGGVAIFREDGKFQKPEGWEPPNHKRVMDQMKGQATLIEWAQYYKLQQEALRKAKE